MTEEKYIEVKAVMSEIDRLNREISKIEGVISRKEYMAYETFMHEVYMISEQIAEDLKGRAVEELNLIIKQKQERLKEWQEQFEKL